MTKRSRTEQPQLYRARRRRGRNSKGPSPEPVVFLLPRGVVLCRSFTSIVLTWSTSRKTRVRISEASAPPLSALLDFNTAASGILSSEADCDDCQAWGRPIDTRTLWSHAIELLDFTPRQYRQVSRECISDVPLKCLARHRLYYQKPWADRRANLGPTQVSVRLSDRIGCTQKRVLASRVASMYNS